MAYYYVMDKGAKVGVIVLAIALIGITLYPVFVSAEEDYNIPDWIKKIAGWWSKGQVGDTDFVNGIKYLIENDIMIIGGELKSTPKTETQTVQKMDEVDLGWETSSGTLTSFQDPGVGHETHQLAIILPPTSNVYKGILSYDASEPIQLVALHGPLGPGDVQGQAIWTPDGKTKFAMTFVDPQTSMGSWVFTGNALAVHTLHSDQFTVSYSVSYMEKEPSDTVLSGTIESMQDPGLGHETHQIVIILPPSDNTYHGVLTYSASESIQLITLHGPLEQGDDNGQAIWIPDGKTKFALTFVDNDDAMGTWVFAGNALAVHTLNEDQFTVSYSVVAGQ